MRANSSAIITCSQQLYWPFYIYQLQQIHISGITFAGCRMELCYITNELIERNSFVNRTRYSASGAALNVQDSSVLIRLCVISNNNVYNGTVYGLYSSNFIIEQTTFRENYYQYTGCCGTYGRAIYLTNVGNVSIFNSNFYNNSANYDAHGGAIYASNVAAVTITGAHFSDNRAGSTSGHGGAVYFDGGNITVTNSTFINNTASGGGGGAIYSARRYTNVSLTNNIFHDPKYRCLLWSVGSH